MCQNDFGMVILNGGLYESLYIVVFFLFYSLIHFLIKRANVFFFSTISLVAIETISMKYMYWKMLYFRHLIDPKPRLDILDVLKFREYIQTSLMAEKEMFGHEVNWTNYGTYSSGYNGSWKPVLPVRLLPIYQIISFNYQLSTHIICVSNVNTTWKSWI